MKHSELRETGKPERGRKSNICRTTAALKIPKVTQAIPELKEEAGDDLVEIAQARGSVKQIAEEYCVSPELLYRWRREAA